MGNFPRELIAEELRRRIATGQLPVGQRLPTEHRLAAEFRVSRGTIRSALQNLASDGVIEQRPRLGSFVTGKQEEAKRITFLFPRHEGLKEQIVQGMESRTAELGYELCMHSLTRTPSDVSTVAAALRKLNTAGVVFIPFIEPDYNATNNRILDICETYRLRYVVVDSPIASHGIIRGDFIGTDFYTTTRQLVHRLCQLGHRNFASIRVFAGVYSADQWFRGIIDQLSTENLPVRPELHRIIEDVPLPQQGRQQLHKILALPKSDQPSIILCSHDALALNLFDELRRMGQEVPRDLSLVGFDDDYFAEPLELASVRQPRIEIGRRAIDMLIQNTPARRQEFLPCEILLRKSIAFNQTPPGERK